MSYFFCMILFILVFLWSLTGSRSCVLHGWMPWEWMNNDKNWIIAWTIPLNLSQFAQRMPTKLVFPISMTQRNFRIQFGWNKHISLQLLYMNFIDRLAETHKPFQWHLVLFYIFFSVFVLDLCTMDNGGCSHNCTIAPGEGVLCSCPVGMELGTDNKTCQIQSFCAKHLKCSQRCMQEKATVKCACYEGWALGPDGESCKSTGEGNTWWRTGRIKIPRIFQFY